MAKKLLVKDILDTIIDDTNVDCRFYAYGIFYASSMADGMKTAKECKEGMNYDCLHAVVSSIWTNLEDDGKCVIKIGSELAH